MVERPTTALVLAGGGSLGAVQVGMLRELFAAGERFDFIVGASAGAINGAYFAANPTSAGIAALENIWRAITRWDVMPLSITTLLNVMLRRDYIVDGSALRRLLHRHLGDGTIENASLPEERRFSAVMAAMPALVAANAPKGPCMLLYGRTLDRVGAARS